MTAGVGRPRRCGSNARSLGALAVVGVVIAASLSATLAKRADTPGVLIAFWRLVVVSIVWNVYLRFTGRHVTWADARQALVPGVCFGLTLAVFFAGATSNSVANTALIFSMAPFFIVPLGARMFAERLVPGALILALVAFGGVVCVELAAPAGGDSTLRGNTFGALSMLLFVAYVVTTRRSRGDIDVSIFMSTISVIAAITVLPLAILHDDVLAISGSGWRYIVVLALLNGVAAHGWNVYAQQTIPIGTIGVAQIGQPALAVVWASLLLGERVVRGQVVGIGVATGALLAFVLVNERGARRRQRRRPVPGGSRMDSTPSATLSRSGAAELESTQLGYCQADPA